MSSMVGGTADPDELQAVGTPEEPLLSAGSPDDTAQQLGQVQETEQETEQGQDEQQAQVVSDNVPTPTPPPSASHAASPKSVGEAPPKPTLAGGFTSWAKGFRLPSSAAPENPPQASAEAPRSTFSLLTGGFGKRAVAKTPVADAPPAEHRSQVSPVTEGALGTFTKGFLDTSRNAVKVVQIKARHMVSQNKRRYQEGTFDLDMTYITENVIAMGFPAGDISSGFLGYVEGLYRNHMEDVVQFFETHHKGKYKVYNLCSERLYDAALFEGKVACFPFNDHNCPPLHLIGAFCQSAYSWLKGDLENVVVVHCKAGKARTGLMISSLLLYLKFFPTAEESIQYYNQKRCVDGKGLILPSQVRYVKYFERILRDFNGETPSVRKCIFRGIRLHKCPYWIRPAITISDHNGVLFSTKKHPRTKDMMPDDFWFNAPRKGIVVFALPGERCVAELNGDFKVHFQDRHGDFYCWLNTNMMENRLILNAHELDGFDKRKLPSPGFQVEVVILDFDAPLPARRPVPTAQPAVAPPSAKPAEQLGSQESTGAVGDGKADDIFSDSDGEEGSKSGSHRSSKKAAQKEEKPTEEKEVESKSQPEGEVPSSNSFGAFSNAFSNMRNAMDRVRITQNPWVVGAKPSSADNAEGASAAGPTEGAPKEGDKVSLEVSKAGQGVERVEQTSGGSELAPGEPGQKEIPSPAQEVVGSAADGKEPGHEVPAGAETSGVEQPDDSATPSDFKAMAAANAADASLFTFGDDEDYDSEEEG